MEKALRSSEGGGALSVCVGVPGTSRRNRFGSTLPRPIGQPSFPLCNTDHSITPFSCPPSILSLSLSHFLARE